MLKALVKTLSTVTEDETALICFLMYFSGLLLLFSICWEVWQASWTILLVILGQSCCCFISLSKMFIQTWSCFISVNPYSWIATITQSDPWPFHRLSVGNILIIPLISNIATANQLVKRVKYIGSSIYPTCIPYPRASLFSKLLAVF